MRGMYEGESIYRVNKDMFLGYLTEVNLLLGGGVTKFGNYDMGLADGNKIVLKRVYDYSGARAIKIVEGFDVFEATMMRKSLKHLDLGSISMLAITLKKIDNLEILVGDNLTELVTGYWKHPFDLKNLKHLSLNALEYLTDEIIANIPKLELLSIKSCKRICSDVVKDKQALHLQKLIVGNQLKEVESEAFSGSSIEVIEFYGTEEEFRDIKVGSENEGFTNAEVKFMY